MPIFYRRGVSNNNHSFSLNIFQNFSILNNYSYTPQNNIKVTPYIPPPSAPIITQIYPAYQSIIVYFILPDSTNVTDVQYSINGTDYLSFSPPSIVTSGTITGLTNGETYTVTLKAVTSSTNKSLPSNSLSVSLQLVLNEISSDVQGNCTGAYSSKLININYTGPVFVVRRSSDNAIESIYVSTTGVYTVTNGTLFTVWLGGDTAYITTWYDQSVNSSNNATQNNTGLQPTFDISTNLVNFTNNAYFNLPNNTVPRNNTSYTLMVKHANINSSNGGFIGSGTYGLSNRTNAFRTASNQYDNYWWSNDFNFGTYSPGNTITTIFDGTARNGYVNNTFIATYASATGRSLSTNNTLGVSSISNSEYLNGEIYYLYMFNTNISSNDMTILYQNS